MLLLNCDPTLAYRVYVDFVKAVRTNGDAALSKIKNAPVYIYNTAIILTCGTLPMTARHFHHYSGRSMPPEEGAMLGEIDVANGKGVSLATGPEGDDNGTSGTTPRPASV
jgi:hypothetical protein